MDVNATLIVQCFFFLSFVGLMRVFFWPTIDGILAKRQLDIEEGIERARAAEDEIERAHKESKIIVRKAQEKAQAVIENAMKEAVLLAQQTQKSAVEQKEKIIQDAYKDIEQEKIIARHELQKDIVGIALLMVQKVLKKHSDITDKVFMASLNNDIDEMAS